MKKFSILGLILVAASAVTAAFVPNKDSKDADFAQLPSATGSTAGTGLTCEITETADLGRQVCDIDDTLFTSTTGGDEGSSDGANGSTTWVQN